MTREEAVSKFNLYGARIGDLCVFGDKNTVFGELDQPTEELPSPIAVMAPCMNWIFPCLSTTPRERRPARTSRIIAT